MEDWVIEELAGPGGSSHFAEFVASLIDPKDIRDAAVLVDVLKSRGNLVREPVSKSLGDGLFELRGTTVRLYFVFKPGRRSVLLGRLCKKT